MGNLEELQLCPLSRQSVSLLVHVSKEAGEVLPAQLLYHLVGREGGQVRSGQSAAVLVAHSGGHIVLQSEVHPLKVAVSLLSLQGQRSQLQGRVLVAEHLALCRGEGQRSVTEGGAGAKGGKNRNKR